MRESRVLKILCYILIPILVLILGISIFYESCKERYLNSSWDDKQYFESDDFVFYYMQALSNETADLIYNNARYNSMIDESYIIYYNEEDSTQGLIVENFYYLIIYRNKAFTNVELTAQTSSIEGIKNFIDNNKENGKYANLIYGEVSSNSELLKNKAIKYFNLFENTYYTTEKYLEDTNLYNVDEFDEGTTKIYNIYTEKIDDLEIYSSYIEKVSESENTLFYKEITMYLNRFEKIFVIAIPVTAILLVLIAIYLIVSIGHTKDKDGVEINDLDKIPIEIVTAVVAGIVILLISGAYYLIRFIIKPENIAGIASLFLAMYSIGYILCATWGITLVKRIKSKTLLKTSLIVIILKIIYKWIKKSFRWAKKGTQKFFKRIEGKIPTFLKVFVGIIIASLLAIFAGPIGAVCAAITGILIAYPIIVELNDIEKVEKQLGKIYEGKYKDKLSEDEFSKRLQKSVEYINDISSGFEKAIEEGIKSEKLKTELITNVSHDIKTPLTSIINYVDLLKKENIKNEKAKEYLDILDSKSQRLKKLTEDLVEASKASSGNIKLNLENINICELIKQATGEFEDKFEEHKLEVIANYPEKDLYIEGDNRYVYRVIENLFSNISKYALENSRVYIDVKKINEKANITIKNISKDKLNISAEELMQRFVRGDKSRTTEGSGLGMSISKSLTELQKGRFDLQIDGDLFKVELEFNIIEKT